MIKLSTSIFFILFSSFGFAQIVNIPNSNFRNALLNSNCVDIDGDQSGDVPADFNNDGQIQVSEAESVIGLVVKDLNISSLQGIQSFKNLEFLYCSDNPLTSIDLSQNTELVTFWCARAFLTQIDVSQSPNLENFRVSNNLISTINLTQSQNLNYIDLTGNNLTTLDVTQNIELIQLDCSDNNLTSLDLSANVNLESIWCSGNPLTTLDTSHNVLLRQLACAGTPITNFDVSENVNLEYLIVFSGELTHIDVTNNPALTFLDITFNEISSLDLSQNPLLIALNADENQLTSLSFDNNPMMDWVQCNSNQINEIDFSQLINLRYIEAKFNNLQKVNIRSGNNTFLEYFNVSDNSNLSCIEVDDVNYANSQSNWYKDPSASYSETCVLGITEVTNENLISIYPIPVTNSLFVETKSNAKMAIEIYSITGVKLFSNEIETNTPIDLSSFHSGVYIVNIQQESHQFFKRIIKL